MRIPGKKRLHQPPVGGGGALTLLQPSDFTLTRKILIPNNGYAGGFLNIASATGHTFRNVGGDPRVIVSMPTGSGSGPAAIEFSLTGLVDGVNSKPTETNFWRPEDLFAGTVGGGATTEVWSSFWCDPEDWNSMWHTAVGYLSTLSHPATFSSVSKRTIGAYDSGLGYGAVSGVRQVVLENIDYTLTHAGPRRIPASFKSTYGVTQDFIIGFGGGFRHESTPQSLGLFAALIPDIDGYSIGDTVDEADMPIVADHTSGTVVTDRWHSPNSEVSPGAFDRGVRGNGHHYPFIDGGNSFSPTHGGFGWVDTDGSIVKWSRGYTPGWGVSASIDPATLRWFSTDAARTVVSKFGSTITLDAGAAATDIYYTPYAGSPPTAFVCLVPPGGDYMDEVFYNLTAYNPTTKMLTLERTVTEAVDGTWTIDIGRFPDPPWFNIDTDQFWWTGANWYQDGGTTFRRPAVATSGPTTTEDVQYGATVASRDFFWKLTLNDPIPLPFEAGLFLTPDINPPVHRDDRMQWTKPTAPDDGSHDGRARWTWSDNPWNSPQWIHGDTKHGFVLIGDFTKGNVFKSNFHIACERTMAELQIFDPADFGAVLNSTMEAWEVQPESTADLADITDDIATNHDGLIAALQYCNDAGQPWPFVFGRGIPAGKSGATGIPSVSSGFYDPINKKYYAVGISLPNGSYTTLYEYAVDC